MPKSSPKPKSGTKSHTENVPKLILRVGIKEGADARAALSNGAAFSLSVDKDDYLCIYWN
jgi:hypothetical protein